MAQKAKDPLAYKKERDSFLGDLQRFHLNRGTPFQLFPTIRGRDVDLFKLYSEVTALGGWEKVNEEGRWEELGEQFGLPSACTNADQALKWIYIRYLDIYERIHHRGEDPDKQNEYGEDASDNPLSKKRKTPIGGVALRYNYQQHNIPNYMRENFGMSLDFMPPSPYSKLERSLLSGLPNEVDFAFNICTLLSNEGKHTLRLDDCPNLLTFMLAHVGVFHEEGNLRFLYDEGWRKASKRNFLRFWYESVTDSKVRTMLFPKVLTTPEIDPLEEDADDCISLSGVLNLGRDMGMKDKEGQRAMQLGMILRNLSFERGNMRTLSTSPLVLRFLMLCIHCNYGNLRQLALDTLGNMALQMVLQPVKTPSTKVILSTMANCIASRDKFEIISGLDILARLCQVEDNEDLLSEAIETKVYEDIVKYLTVHDIQLIVYTLECLYQLSELGEATTSEIAQVHCAVPTLVSLVTIEAQSYGPESIRGIKVVEHVSTEQAQQQARGVAAPASSTVAPTQTPTPQPVSRPAVVPTPPRPQAVATPPPLPRPSAPVTPVAAAATVPTVAHASPGQPIGMDVETLCSKWLSANFELSVPHFMMPRLELYSEYMQACSKFGMRGVSNAVSFANCVRVSYPTLELVKVDKENGSTDFQYKGLRRRTIPLPFPPPESGLRVGLPVMTAQQSPQQPSRVLQNSPYQQPAQPKSQTDSTLIKSLLANKLAQNMQRMQQQPPATVAQPQLQQQQNIVQQPQPVQQQGNQMLVQQQQQQQQQQQPIVAQQLPVSTVTPPPTPSPQPTQLPQPAASTAKPTTNTAIPTAHDATPTTAAVKTEVKTELPNAIHSNSSLPGNDMNQSKDIVCNGPGSQIKEEENAQHMPLEVNTDLAKKSGQAVMVNGVASPASSSQPPTPLGSEVDGQPPTPVSSHADDEDSRMLSPKTAISPSIEEKKAKIAQLMKDTSIVKEQMLMNGIVCHATGNGDISKSLPCKKKENGEVLEEEIKKSRGCVLENGCPSPTHTPNGNGDIQQHPAIPAPVNGDINGPVEGQVQDSVISNQAEPMDTSDSGASAAQASACNDSAEFLMQSGQCNNKNVNAHNNNEQTVASGGQHASSEACSSANSENPTQTVSNPADTPQSVQPAVSQATSNPSAGGPQASQHPAPISSQPANPSQSHTQVPPQQQAADTPHPQPEQQQSVHSNPQPVVNPQVAQQPQQQQVVQQPQQQVSAPPQQLPPGMVQQSSYLAGAQIAPQHVVIQQGGTQKVVQLGQPIMPQQQLKQQQMQQQQQAPHLVQSQQPVQPQQQQVVVQQAPIVAQNQIQQQVLQVQVPPGQQVLQVRMPPSNGQPQLLHVHVPQGPGQPPHIMQVAIPPAPNGQAQTVQVQVRPNNQAAQQQQLQQPKGVQPGMTGVRGQPGRVPCYAPQQPTAIPTPASQAAVVPGSIPNATQGQIHVNTNQGQRQNHPILQQHLQQPSPNLPSPSLPSPSGMKRPPSAGPADQRKRPAPSPQPGAGGSVGLAPQKKGKRTNSVESNQSSGGQSQQSLPSPSLPGSSGQQPQLVYMCEWDGCKRCFDKQCTTHKHAMSEHFNKDQKTFHCLWEGCDRLARGRWSFVQHLQDRHLSEAALKAAALRRLSQPAAPVPAAAPAPAPAPPPAPAVYPEDAAVQAIRRFAIKPPYPELVESKEGPVTKHIRLTSALILRNMARYSPAGRSKIKRHEEHLAYVAFSNVESSTALSNCLAELHKSHVPKS